MKKIILRIGGMSCSACSGGLQKYLNKQRGVINASVNLVMASASVEYNDDEINMDTLAKYVESAGFECIGEYSKTQDKETRSSKKLFFIHTLLAVLMMYVSMGHMMGLPTPDLIDMHKSPLWYYLISLALAIPFLAYGYDIIKSGIKNIIHLTPNMDSLVTMGIFSALIYSIAVSVLVIVGVIPHAMEVYYESAAIVIYFVKLGRYIDKSSKSRTKNAIASLVQITPSYAYIKRNGSVEKVPLDEVREGDTVVCHPGERIAVDGQILVGSAHIDESFITGESKPSPKKVGDTVLAGSVNINGYVEYLAIRVGKNSTVSEIVRLVLEASSTKSPIARAVDKICLYFVPTVCGTAILSLLIHLIAGLGFSSAVGAFITVLVVACPCALGLATPLATVISEGELARDGILIKRSDILENASKINTVIFDKTGTLTYGKMKISQCIIADGDKSELLLKACSLEKGSSHPIATAFADYMDANRILPVDVSDFKVIEGAGVYGKIGNEDIYLVNRKYLDTLNVTNALADKESELSLSGNSIVYMVVNSKLHALFGISDTVRDGVSEELSTLAKEGIECIMLTGDNEKTAHSVAEKLGISRVIANVTPKEKAEFVKSLKAEGRTCAMVGDGINDAVALTCADLSISIHGATDIAMDCSDVILTRSSIDGISGLIKSSKRTLKIIKENLFFAFLYNSLMIPIAAGALLSLGVTINPMIASLAMVLSSVCVSLNSLRLIKRRKNVI